MELSGKQNTITFNKFRKFPHVLCVMSTRKLGDLNVGRLPLTNANKLLRLYNLNINSFVAMQQVHGNRVKYVDRRHGNQMIVATDALITREANLFLGVKTADCIPFFFYDPRQHLVAVAHAGWRGTKSNIVIRVIDDMVRLGSQPVDIYAITGPGIGSCCYTVNYLRAEHFLKKFGHNGAVFKNDHQWHLDLMAVNKILLLQAGLTVEHLSFCSWCTSCYNQNFFSYRKDSPQTYGEMLGIIGIKD